jgi:hypothetical protein
MSHEPRDSAARDTPAVAGGASHDEKVRRALVVRAAAAEQRRGKPVAFPPNPQRLADCDAALSLAEQHVAALTAELREARFDASTARGECDMAIAAAVAPVVAERDALASRCELLTVLLGELRLAYSTYTHTALAGWPADGHRRLLRAVLDRVDEALKEGGD